MTAPGSPSGEGAHDDELDPLSPSGGLSEQSAWEAPGTPQNSPAPPPAPHYPDHPYPPPGYSSGYQPDYPPSGYQPDYPPPGYQPDYPPPGYQPDYPPSGYQPDYPPSGYQPDYPPPGVQPYGQQPYGSPYQPSPPPPQFGGPPPGYGPAPQPGGYPGVQPGPYYPPPEYQGGYGPTRTNPMAIASLIASIAGLFCCGLPSVAGVVLGVVALNQIKRTREEGHGLAVAGIVIGSAILVLMLIFLAFRVSANR